MHNLDLSTTETSKHNTQLPNPTTTTINTKPKRKSTPCTTITDDETPSLLHRHNNSESDDEDNILSKHTTIFSQKQYTTDTFSDK